MDINALRDRIQRTLDPNADTRRQAELDLKYVRVLAIQERCAKVKLISLTGGG